MFRHLCRLSTTPGRFRIGTTMTRFTTDLGSTRNWVSRGIASVLVSVAALAAGGFTLTFLDWRLGVATVVPLLLCGLVAAASSIPFSSAERAVRRWRGELSNRIGDGLLVLSTFQHLGLVDRESQRLSDVNDKLNAALVRRARWAGVLRYCVDAVVPLAAATVLALHGWDAGGAPLPSASIVSWLFGLSVALGPFRDAARAWDYRLVYLQAAARIDRLLAAQELIELPTETSAAAEPRGALGLADVRLAGRAIPVSLAAAPRELVAVTGNAAARSALFAVVARLSPPESGTVTLDGVPVGSFTARHFCHAISLVSPTLPLVPGTVRENLAAGIEPIEDPALMTALARCRLVGSLPKGLDTRVRMIADGLAPGIRARIALARALVRKPRVLLIDDPLLLAEPDGRAALTDLAAARERTMLVALDDPHALGVPDREWALGAALGAGPSIAAARKDVFQHAPVERPHL
jgi:ABC-type multidrug transport system fused ATPase/permease subunit